MHPDVSAEQSYFDHALEQRERARAQLDRAPDMAGDPTAAAELRARLGSVGLADPDEGVAFGRIDRHGENLYIGKNAIWDENNDLLVINWQAPAASAFYTATPADSQGLDARRTFRCESNQVLDIDELIFKRLAGAVEGALPSGAAMGDALLESLGRNRSGELGDIVATIQAAQYDVVSRPVEQLLVVQGGPGTGKTVVGLHRASWLLFNLSHRLQSEDVLVVGPNPAFVRYIRAVLPKLGDEAVVQKSVTELGPRVRSGRVEPAIMRRLKGDRRMIELIVRGLRNRQRVSIDSGPVELTVDNRRVTLDPQLIAARASQLERRPHNEAHKGLRDFVVQEVQSYLGRRGILDSAALEATTRGTSARDIDNYLDRVWPNLTPQGFLLDLLSTRSQLEAAAAGILDEHEVALLSVPREAKVGSYEWSVDDVPLLDAADFLLNGPQRMYAYIVIDEAQDLSPMQLLSIARRSRNGWMTVLGDLAQATSPAALGSWNEVADHLYRADVPANLAELRLGYRLPTEVHEVAMRLLRQIAPGLATPEAVRPSGNPVLVDLAELGEVPPAIVSRVRSLLGTGLIGIITPEEVRDSVTTALDKEGLFWAPELQAATAPIVVMSAERAKGLEFDNVVVVEPADIIADHGENGMRALFVALTRCTQRLAIVHAQPLPRVLGLRSTPVGPGGAVAPVSASRSADMGTAPEEEPEVTEATGPDPGPSTEQILAEIEALEASGPAPAAWAQPGGGAPAAAEAPVPPPAAGAPGVPPPPPPPPAGAHAAGAPGAPAGPGGAPGAAPAPSAPPGPDGETPATPEPGEMVGVVTAPIGTAARSYRSGRRPRSGGELEQQVAATVTSAIATSLATTLRRLVQPALLPDIVDELGRLVAGPADLPGGEASGEAIAVELPAGLVEQATQAVADGQADSVSAYIAAALEERSKLAAVSGYVTQMLSDSGAVAPPPGSPEPPS
jgi:DNA helicase IV